MECCSALPRREAWDRSVQRAKQDSTTNGVQEMVEYFAPALTCKMCNKFIQNAGILPCGHPCCIPCFQNLRNHQTRGRLPVACYECGVKSTYIIEAPEIDSWISGLHLTANKFIGELAKREPSYKYGYGTKHYLLITENDKVEDARTALTRYRQGTYRPSYWKDGFLPAMEWITLGICGIIGIYIYQWARGEGWSTRELVTPTLTFICLVLMTYMMILRGFKRRRRYA